MQIEAGNGNNVPNNVGPAVVPPSQQEGGGPSQVIIYPNNYGSSGSYPNAAGEGAIDLLNYL